MSIRNIKAANNTEALTVNGIPYTLARSEVFYYLKFIDYDKELFKAASNLTAKPTVIFYTENAQNKVILDYSLANETDQTYLSSFFANMTQIDTFGLTLGNYLDKSELAANVGCSLVFDEFKDNKIFARVTSVTNQNTALDVYFGDYFIGTPQLTKAGSLGSTTNTVNYALISVNPNTSKPLSSLGMVVGDLIEVVNTESDNNQIKFEITEITKINDKEVLKIKPTNNTVPVLESLLGYSSLLNVYVKGTTTLAQQLTGDLGCCYGDVENIENNTEYQCSIRGGKYFSVGVCNASGPATTSSQFTISVNSGGTVYSVPVLQEYVYASSVFEASILYTKQGTSLVPDLKLTVINGSSNQIQNNNVILNTNNTYSFTQPDSTNQGHIIRFSSTKDEFTPYVSDITGFITSNGLGSTHNVRTNAAMPILYMYLEKKTVSADAQQTVIEYFPTKYSLVLNTNQLSF